jgi:lipopolysaccharide export system protein LptA
MNRCLHHLNDRALNDRSSRLTAFPLNWPAALVAVFAAIILIAGVGGAFAQNALQDSRKLPIEIEADSLEVLQEKQIAIFSGNVDAQQGTIRLSADILRVHYIEDGNDSDPSSIRRIDAEGAVLFSSEAQTAQGDSGVYDVENGIVTLIGSVVLTQGENVIRGQRLVLNLETGKSKVDGGGPGSGRVRGLFVPQANEDE